jgi:hypothetical protein
MDILDSALAREIETISSNANTQVSYYWRAEIHAGENTLPALKVLSSDIKRDYESNFTDEMFVSLVLGGGQYAYKVYPNLSRLEITLYKQPLEEVGGQPDNARVVESERYVATLIDPIAINVASNSSNELDEFALDISNLITLNFQLVNKAVDQIRMKTVGGIYRRVKVEDVIKSVMTVYSAQVETDTTDIPRGVEMITSPNQETQEHIVIPHGTRLVDIPDYIHKHCSGIYTTGLAYYYQSNHWYVFPPYDNSKFDQSPQTLTAIRIPANRMPGVERTYRKDGNNLVILATGQANVKNESESQLLSAGNGVRFADANQFMDGIVQKSGNKAVISRGGVNNEFITTDRPNGNNLVLSSPKRITSNPWLEYSRLAARNGSLIGLTWENSNPSLILPGMPVKVLYLEDEQIKETYGLVIKAHHYTQTRGEGITVSRHRTTTALTIFAKRELS